MQYFETEGYPKIKKSELIAEAFIIGDDLMVNYLTDKLMSVLKKHGITCNCFKSKTEANSWLLEKISK